MFYDFLNLFKEINFNVKGSSNQSICKVYIDEIWHIEGDASLLSIRNFIKDFKGEVIKYDENQILENKELFFEICLNESLFESNKIIQVNEF